MANYTYQRVAFLPHNHLDYPVDYSVSTGSTMVHSPVSYECLNDDLPELTDDEGFSSSDEEDYNNNAASNNNNSNIRNTTVDHEKNQLQALLLKVITNKIIEQQPQLNTFNQQIYQMIVELLKRSQTSIDQLFKNLIILQRLAQSNDVLQFSDFQKLVINSFVLGNYNENELNINKWSAISGLAPRDLVKNLNQSLINFACASSVCVVQHNEINEMKINLKSEVEKMVKVI